MEQQFESWLQSSKSEIKKLAIMMEKMRATIFATIRSIAVPHGHSPNPLWPQEFFAFFEFQLRNRDFGRVVKMVNEGALTYPRVACDVLFAGHTC